MLEVAHEERRLGAGGARLRVAAARLMRIEVPSNTASAVARSAAPPLGHNGFGADEGDRPGNSPAPGEIGNVLWLQQGGERRQRRHRGAHRQRAAGPLAAALGRRDAA